jgi:hypothetical protein
MIPNIKIPFINNRSPSPTGTVINPSVIARQNILTSADVKKDPTYIKICESVEKLILNGVPIMGQGYCISVSDVVQNFLIQNGVPCRLVEVQVSIQDKATGHIEIVGFDNQNKKFEFNNDSEIDTHVVVVTETEFPFLIDASIAHLLPKKGTEVIVDVVNGTKDKDLAVLNFDKQILIYQEKTKTKIPRLHQSSIINRIATDQRIFKEIGILKKLNYIGIGLSLFALINVLLKLTGNW